MFPFRCCGRVRWGEMGIRVCVRWYTWAVVQKCTCGWLNCLVHCLEGGETFCGCCDTSLSVSLLNADAVFLFRLGVGDSARRDGRLMVERFWGEMGTRARWRSVLFMS